MLPLASPKYQFKAFAIFGAPEDRGLYALYRDEEILCIGVAAGNDTIRSRLLEHFNAVDARWSDISHYQWELSYDPVGKREEYLNGHERKYPAC